VDFDQPPVPRVEAPDLSALPRGRWPLDIPAVAQVVAAGLDLTRGVTFLVGENGSGKSTIVEEVAVAYGLSPEGGSAGSRDSTRPTDSALGEALVVRRGLGAERRGSSCAPRRCTGGPRNPDPRFHELSHGESFLAVLETRFDSPGFSCLDEPEAALSFSSTLGRIAVLQRLVAAGGQVLCATHSPVLASLPGARILGR